jgi:hypothetical protein
MVHHLDTNKTIRNVEPKIFVTVLNKLNKRSCASIDTEAEILLFSKK